jgi:hypothetical protein
MRLFCDPHLRQELGKAGRSYVEEHHRWERCLAPFADLLDLPASEGQGAAAPAAEGLAPRNALVTSGKEPD